MATSVVITCPKCSKQLKASSELAGKKVRCKGCGETFPVQLPSDKKAEQKGPIKVGGSSEWDDKSPYGLTDTSLTVRCPFCAKEMENEEQIICLNCGYNTRTRTRLETKMTYDHTAGDYFLWLLPGILCVVAILLMIAFNVVYLLVAREWLKSMARDSWFWDTLNFGGIKLWIFIMTLFATFYTGRFAIRRLILNPRPPEKVKKKKSE